MKPPKLKKNESTKSFKARVKAWERATGKKYPRTFSGKTDSERVLDGAVRVMGLEKFKDYTTDYADEIKEYSTEKARVTQASKTDQQVKDEKKEAFLEKKHDYSNVKEGSVKESNNEKVKINRKGNGEKVVENGNKEETGKKNGKENKKALKIKKKYTARDRMREKNRKIFGKNSKGEDRVNLLIKQHEEWKKARKAGKLDEWRRKYGK